MKEKNVNQNKSTREQGSINFQQHEVMKKATTAFFLKHNFKASLPRRHRT